MEALATHARPGVILGSLGILLYMVHEPRISLQINGVLNQIRRLNVSNVFGKAIKWVRIRPPPARLSSPSLRWKNAKTHRALLFVINGVDGLFTSIDPWKRFLQKNPIKLYLAIGHPAREVEDAPQRCWSAPCKEWPYRRRAMFGLNRVLNTVNNDVYLVRQWDIANLGRGLLLSRA